jgi:adenylosuccinate lyase
MDHHGKHPENRGHASASVGSTCDGFSFMISRYARPEMTALWSDATRYETWARVEVLACEAQARLGHIPGEVLDHIRRAPVPSAAAVAEQERQRDHEVLSFLAAYCAGMPSEAARWVHLGMTSYDLVDTALGHLLGRAVDLVLADLRRLRAVLAERAREHWDTICLGRTHGVHAEPTTFGHKLAGFAFAVHRSTGRVALAGEAVRVGTLSGSVGTYSLIDPRVEAEVCAALGLGIEPVPSQIVARDRHAQLVQAMATAGACVEHLALELRLLQRSEVQEVEEHRSPAYQGSSAMPHKRNPTTSERLCGLARVLRGYASMALEDVAVWHERDLAHSSVERIVLPDCLSLAHYLAGTACHLVETLQVFPDRMRRALEQSAEVVCSSGVLAGLLREPGDREATYRTVQRAADHAARTGESLAGTLGTAGLTVDVPAPGRFLRHHDVVLARLEELRELDR